MPKMPKTIRVTISIDLADDVLELFRNNLESGYDFDPATLDEYAKFRASVAAAKARLKIEYVGGKVAKQ